MTISLHNSTYETCPICCEDYADGEREDTAKVVELACHHFQHIECTSLWFRESEKKGVDLTCGYCTQVSMPKRESLHFTPECLEAHFSRIERDPYQGSKAKVIHCLKELRSRSESILDLLSNIIGPNGLTETGETEFLNWIKANIQPQSRYIVCKVLAEFLTGGGMLKTMREEIRELSYIPTERWSAIIPEEGVAVCTVTSDGAEFRMKVSKDYLQRVAKDYVYRKKYNIPDFDRIHNLGKFKESLGYITEKYHYDPEVSGCFQDAQNLREDISNLIQSNSALSTEGILSLIKEMVGKSKVSDSSKRTIPLLINEILFDRGALRTLSQEINRWTRVPIEEWPVEMKEEGVYFLDEDNSVQHCKIKDFEERVTSQLRSDRTSSIAKVVFVGITAGIAIRNILGGRL